jgi:hypothetical protein
LYISYQSVAGGDKFDLVAENSLVGVAETAGKFAEGVLVGVELPEGFVEFAEKIGVGIVQVAAEESWVE